MGPLLLRASRGVGGAAHQEPVAEDDPAELPAVRPGQTITSLIEEFHYPRLRPGDDVARGGQRGRDAAAARCASSSDVTRIVRRGRPHRCASRCGASGACGDGPAERDFISSMPRHRVRAAARSARPRRGAGGGARPALPRPPHRVPDRRRGRTCSRTTGSTSTTPGCRSARIQNFKNWSPDMVPDPGKTSPRPRVLLPARATRSGACPTPSSSRWRARSSERIGLARAEDVEDGCVFRVPNAYPVYDSAYAGHLGGRCAPSWTAFANCQTVGRNGLHRYNNQDHSMLTAHVGRAQTRSSERRHDLWNVNTDREYHEEARTAERRRAEARAARRQAVVAELLQSFDPVAMGLSAAAVMLGALIVPRHHHPGRSRAGRSWGRRWPSSASIFPATGSRAGGQPASAWPTAASLGFAARLGVRRHPQPARPPSSWPWRGGSSTCARWPSCSSERRRGGRRRLRSEAVIRIRARRLGALASGLVAGLLAGRPRSVRGHASGSSSRAATRWDRTSPSSASSSSATR